MNNNRLCIVILVVLSVCLISPSTINAQNTRGDIRGSFGEIDCGLWVALRQADAQGHPSEVKVAMFWALGYISGLNWNAADKNVVHHRNAITNNQIYLYIDKYCRENPLKDISGAVRKLWNELPDIRLMELE